MDPHLYDEMARLEATYWWFVAKRNILCALLDRHVWLPGAGARRGATTGRDSGGDMHASLPTVCDIGCGTGGLLAAINDRYTVTGTDSAPLAREHCARRGLVVLDGVLPDGLPFAPGIFDAVVVSDVFEHVTPDKESAIAIARLLRPGGVLIATVPAHPWMWTKRDEYHHHVRRYTKPAFAALFEGAGLDKVLLSYYNIATFPVMIAARIGKKLLGNDKAEEDIRPLPGPINAALRWSFEAEKWVLPIVPSPVGASLLAVYRKGPESCEGVRALSS